MSESCCCPAAPGEDCPNSPEACLVMRLSFAPGIQMLKYAAPVQRVTPGAWSDDSVAALIAERDEYKRQRDHILDEMIGVVRELGVVKQALVASEASRCRLLLGQRAAVPDSPNPFLEHAVDSRRMGPGLHSI